ncbi:hypothetical protein GCM10010207_35300 [Streptomyces atratus]|nr:hypothetical protein GCM10010207_35300 [Streptomyces atratus]
MRPLRGQSPARRTTRGCDWKATQEIGFDDVFQYEDFAKPPGRRSGTLEQLHPELGATSYEAWVNKANRHPY